MADMKQIHEFAVKWCDKFRNQNINYIEMVDHYMADEADVPLPLEHTKHIIRKCADEDYVPPKE